MTSDRDLSWKFAEGDIVLHRSGMFSVIIAHVSMVVSYGLSDGQPVMALGYRVRSFGLEQCDGVLTVLEPQYGRAPYNLLKTHVEEAQLFSTTTNAIPMPSSKNTRATASAPTGVLLGAVSLQEAFTVLSWGRPLYWDKWYYAEQEDIELLRLVEKE